MRIFHVLYIFYSNSSLHLANGAEVHVFTQRVECPDSIESPEQRSKQEGGDKERKDNTFTEDEYTRHENLENANTPHESIKGYGPRLTLRLIRFVEN